MVFPRIKSMKNSGIKSLEVIYMKINTKTLKIFPIQHLEVQNWSKIPKNEFLYYLVNSTSWSRSTLHVCRGPRPKTSFSWQLCGVHKEGTSTWPNPLTLCDHSPTIVFAMKGDLILCICDQGIAFAKRVTPCTRYQQPAD